MLERRPARTLEVGLAYGGSALAIAATHQELGHAGTGPHTVFDPFQADGWDNAALAALDPRRPLAPTSTSGHSSRRSAWRCCRARMPASA
jgi:hypothetical protein